MKEETKLTLNIYDENDNVKRTEEAKFVDLRFGTIRSLMQLLKVEDINDTAQLLKVVYSAWEQVTGILSADEGDIRLRLGTAVPQQGRPRSRLLGEDLPHQRDGRPRLHHLPLTGGRQQQEQQQEDFMVHNLKSA